MLSIIKKYSKTKSEAIIVDVPLLFESGFHKNCDLTVAVLANVQVRTDRVMKRDGIDFSAASARISSQKPDEFYVSRADLTVYNNSDEYSLEAEAKKITDIIRGSKNDA